MSTNNNNTETTNFLNINFDKSIIFMRVRCGSCQGKFLVDSKSEKAWIPFMKMIECPRCSRRYDFEPEKNEWICDYPLIIIENRSTLILDKRR